MRRRPRRPRRSTSQVPSSFFQSPNDSFVKVYFFCIFSSPDSDIETLGSGAAATAAAAAAAAEEGGDGDGSGPLSMRKLLASLSAFSYAQQQEKQHGERGEPPRNSIAEIQQKTLFSLPDQESLPSVTSDGIPIADEYAEGDGGGGGYSGGGEGAGREQQEEYHWNADIPPPPPRDRQGDESSSECGAGEVSFPGICSHFSFVVFPPIIFEIASNFCVGMMCFHPIKNRTTMRTPSCTATTRPSCSPRSPPPPPPLRPG